MESMLTPVTVRHGVAVLPVHERGTVPRGTLGIREQGAAQVAEDVPHQECRKHEYDGHRC